MKVGLFQPLKSKTELFEIKKFGKLIKHDILQIKYLKKKENKLAFVISKKIGNAIVRNRIKRRVRNILKDFNTNDNFFYLLIIVKINLAQISFKELKDILYSNLKIY